MCPHIYSLRWLFPRDSQCGIKYTNKPTGDVPFYEDATPKCIWRCSCIMALCWNKDKHSTYNVKPEINQSFFLLTFFVEDMFLSCHGCHHRFDTFPEFSKVVHILALIPAISCSTEQSFILLVQLKTTFRSNMAAPLHLLKLQGRMPTL